eukprot:3371940-Prymnesium_polylepis.1
MCGARSLLTTRSTRSCPTCSRTRSSIRTRRARRCGRRAAVARGAVHAAVCSCQPYAPASRMQLPALCSCQPYAPASPMH